MATKLKSLFEINNKAYYNLGYEEGHGSMGKGYALEYYACKDGFITRVEFFDEKEHNEPFSKERHLRDLPKWAKERIDLIPK
jgi:hypothetical protein